MFNFTNPRRAHCVLKVLKKCKHFRCTRLLRSIELVYLDYENLTCFSWNMLQNLMCLVLISKSNRKW